jgi:hypothetical protein
MIVRNEREVPGKEIRQVFLDWEDMTDAYERACREGYPVLDWDGPWFGGTRDQLPKFLKAGYAKGVDEAREYIDEVMEYVPMETLGRELSPAPVGYIPVVPAFLAGRPDAMLGLDEDYTPEGTIRIFVSVSATGGASAQELAKRGAAIMALVEALQMIRPVELFVYHCVGSACKPYLSRVQVRMGVTPLDLSEVAASLHSLVYRSAIFQISRWNLESQHDGFPRSSISMHDMVEATEEDIVVPQLWNPHTDEILKNPAAWVKAKVEEAIKGKGKAFAGL